MKHMLKTRLFFLSVLACFFVRDFAWSADLTTNTNAVVISASSNRIENHVLEKEQKSVAFIFHPATGDTCLWIKAHARDKRGIEHGGGCLKIEVNGVTLGTNQCLFQPLVYQTPLHASGRFNPQEKFDQKETAWLFRYDTDFVMNNQGGGPGNWGTYTTTGLNHWYAFDLKGIVKPGENRVVISEQVPSGNDSWKIRYYDGFCIGELALCPEADIKAKIRGYDSSQIKINPDELDWDKVDLARRKKMEITMPPQARSQKYAVKDGYIMKDSKPFFMTYLNHFSSVAGREGLLDIYNYYALINTTMQGGGKTRGEISGLPIYLKDGWEEKNVEPLQIANSLNETVIAYKHGILSFPYVIYYTEQGLGKYLETNYPDICIRDASGGQVRLAHNRDALFPNFTYPLFKEYLRQMYTMYAKTYNGNAGVCGYSAWEEMGWRMYFSEKAPLMPQNDADLPSYRDYLRQKYKAIKALNDEWHGQYNDFSEIKFPVAKEQSANFANYQQWKCAAILDCARIAYETLKKGNPDHLVLGQKTYGDLISGITYWSHAIDNWELTKYTDVSREYGATPAMAHLGRSSAEYYGKAMEANSCYQSTKCFVKKWDKPIPWCDLDPLTLAAYPNFMEDIFNGNKAFHWEMYDLGRWVRFGFVFHGKYWKSRNETMDGKPFDFEKAGTADAVIPSATLNIARMQQWCIRNSSLVLPAKVVKPDVAVLVSTASRLIGYDPQYKLVHARRLTGPGGDNAGQDFYMLGYLFDHLHLKFDCVEERNIDAIFKYKVLVVGYQANAACSATAGKIKAFAQKGGTILFYPEAVSFDAVDFANTPKSPGFGLDALCMTTIDTTKVIQNRGIKIGDSSLFPAFKKDESLSTNKFFAVKLQPQAGAVVLSTSLDNEPVLTGDPSGKCYYFGGYLGLAYFSSYPDQDQFVKLFDALLTKAGVIRPIEVEGASNPRLVVPALMQGRDYYLACVNNFSDKEQSLVVKLNIPAQGKHEVIDISGERPIITRSEDGNYHLKSNFEEAQPRYMKTSVPPSQLNSEGMKLTVPAYFSKIMLIRPADEKVWVNSTDEALRSYVELKKPLKIVTGARSNNYDEEKAVEELRKVLTDKGLSVAVVKDSEIKTKVMEGTLVEDGYELEKYSHVVIDDDANLILIGNASENNVVKHLQTAGNYAYCKVPEMLGEKYPGKGRGIIQIAECINMISYDATDRARDAIILGGSDDAGTVQAIKEFIRKVE